jgi:hypothetical protein
MQLSCALGKTVSDLKRFIAELTIADPASIQILFNDRGPLANHERLADGTYTAAYTDLSWADADAAEQEQHQRDRAAAEFHLDPAVEQVLPRRATSTRTTRS